MPFTFERNDKMQNIIYKLWISSLTLKNEYKISIIDSNISPEEFYKYSISDYINCGIDILTAQEINNSKNLDMYMKLLEYLDKEEINIIIYKDDKYPKELINIPDPPFVLFVKGNLIDFENSIAIVGARRASDYGRAIAYKFAYELSKMNIPVVSGMAKGIDSNSHTGALDAGGFTCAVMGSGFKNIYPAENMNLFNRICKSGCVITEFFPDTRPFPANFPRRNRIISGLAKATLIIEAGERSGSLITASCALNQGKDVFAVPGNIFSPYSKGTNKLIGEGAKLITSVEDVLEEYGVSVIQWNKNKIESLTEKEMTVLNLLKNGYITTESIIDSSGMKVQELLPILSKLECSGIIKKVYGGQYIVC